MPEQTTTPSAAGSAIDPRRASSASRDTAGASGDRDARDAARRDPESAAERTLRRRRLLTGRGAIMIYALLGTLLALDQAGTVSPGFAWAVPAVIAVLGVVLLAAGLEGPRRR